MDGHLPLNPTLLAPPLPPPNPTLHPHTTAAAQNGDEEPSDSWGFHKISERLNSLPSMFQSIIEETSDSLFSPRGDSDSQ